MISTTKWLGDSTEREAAQRPDLKGYGTLTDLHVAMTLDPSLISVVDAALAFAEYAVLGQPARCRAPDPLRLERPLPVPRARRHRGDNAGFKFRRPTIAG